MSRTLGQLINCVLWLFDNFIRLIGPILVLFAVGLTTLMGYLYFATVLPLVLGDTPWAYTLHLLWSIWLVTNLGFNYVMVVTTPPGGVPDDLIEDSELERMLARDDSDDDDDDDERDLELGRGSRFKVCSKCERPKPERAHHCHVCKTCVLRMDHHCPWINGCVGHYNHRYFFLFLFYMCLSCAYAGTVSFYGLMTIARMGISKRSTLLFFTVMTFAVALSVGILLVWHVYLVVTNQTTIEWHINSHKKRQAKLRGRVFINKYDLGVLDNFQLFFGTGRKFWWLFAMPKTRPPQCDGLSYPSVYDGIPKDV